MNSMMEQYLALGGFALLIAAIVNIGKSFGWIQDGQAPTISMVLNLLGFVAFSVFGFIKPSVDWVSVDATVVMIANVLTQITKLALQIFASKFWHDNVLRSVPVLGFSFTARAEAKALARKK